MPDPATAAPVEKPLSRRCLCCRLPADVREELVERARIRRWATYTEIAQSLSARGFRLSEAAVRRHLGHTDTNRYFGLDDGGAGSAEAVPTAFDGLLDGKIMERDVSEAVVKVLVQRMQELERQQRTVQDPATRERLASRYLQTLAALERALKRLEETRMPERDVKKLVAEALERASVAITELYKAGVTDQIAMLKQGVYDLLDQKHRPEEFLRQIARWEHEWPAAMATRVAEAMILSFRAAGAQA